MSSSNDTDDIVTYTDHGSFISNDSTVRHGRVVSDTAVSVPSSQQQARHRELLQSSDPPADIVSPYGESIIMTTDGIQQQQARWNQLKQQQRYSKNQPAADRILPSGVSLTRNSTNRTDMDQTQNVDGTTTMTTTEAQYYATLEHVQSVSVCSELSTTLISGEPSTSPSILTMPNHGDHSHIDTSIVAPEDRSAMQRQGSKKNYQTSAIPSLTQHPNNTNDHPVYGHTARSNNDENLDDFHVSTTSQSRVDAFNDVPTIEEPHRTRQSTRTTENDVENLAVPRMYQDFTSSNLERSNNKKYRSLAIVAITAFLTICIVVVGAVCGSGNCSSSNAPTEASSDGDVTKNNSTDDSTDGVDDDDVQDDIFGIASFVRGISLTNTSFSKSGDSDRDKQLRQADAMAIKWIVNKYSAANTANNFGMVMNISDPMEQQRVQQFYAILTFYYVTNINGMNWSNMDNWLEPETDECDWRGIECISVSRIETRDFDRWQINSKYVYDVVPSDHKEEKLSLNGTSVKSSSSFLPPTRALQSITIAPTIVAIPSTPFQAPQLIEPTTAGAAPIVVPSPTTLSPADSPILDNVPSIVQPSPTIMPTVPSSTRQTISPFTSSPTTMPIVLTVAPQTAFPTEVPLRITPPTVGPSTIPTIPPLASVRIPTQLPTVNPITQSQLFRAIAIISLPNNNIVGPINPNLCLLTSLIKLNLSNNALTGMIPTSFSFCSSLEKLDLSNNNLSGTIPIEIVPSLSDKIRQFNVGSNILTRRIPANIGLWKDIRFFSVKNNQFTGTIPTTIDLWTRINEAHFEDNQLDGTIPETFCTIVLGRNATVTVDEGEVVCTCCDNDFDITTNTPVSVVGPISVDTPISTPMMNVVVPSQLPITLIPSSIVVTSNPDASL